MTWKKILGTVAPTLASALGGPMAGLAVKQISEKVLGVPAGKDAEERVAAAIAGASPEMLAKLKELDQAFAKEMAKLDIDLERIHADDRANARARQVKMNDHTPTAIAAAVIIGFMVGVWFVSTHQIPAENKEVVITMLGALGALATTVVTYYFGSSRSSRTKDEALSRAITKE